MAFRELNDVEKRITQRNLDRNLEELEDAQYSLEEKDRALNKGLVIGFKRRKRQLESELSVLKESVSDLEFSIKVAREQLEKGVETKGDKE